MSPRIKPETSPLPVVRGRRFRIRPRVWACLAILVGTWSRRPSSLAADRANRRP